MVKKIRIDDEPEAPNHELDNQEFQQKMLDYMQAMDWKLWEILKIYQEWALQNGYSQDEENLPRKRDPIVDTYDDDEDDDDIIPIIVDEEDEDI